MVPLLFQQEKYFQLQTRSQFICCFVVGLIALYHGAFNGSRGSSYSHCKLFISLERFANRFKIACWSRLVQALGFLYVRSWASRQSARIVVKKYGRRACRQFKFCGPFLGIRSDAIFFCHRCTVLSDEVQLGQRSTAECVCSSWWTRLFRSLYMNRKELASAVCYKK